MRPYVWLLNLGTMKMQSQRLVFYGITKVLTRHARARKKCRYLENWIATYSEHTSDELADLRASC